MCSSQKFSLNISPSLQIFNKLLTAMQQACKRKRKCSMVSNLVIEEAIQSSQQTLSLEMSLSFGLGKMWILS
jgi:hypothetical protein